MKVCYKSGPSWAVRGILEQLSIIHDPLTKIFSQQEVFLERKVSKRKKKSSIEEEKKNIHHYHTC